MLFQKRDELIHKWDSMSTSDVLHPTLECMDLQQNNLWKGSKVHEEEFQGKCWDEEDHKNEVFPVCAVC